MSGCVPEERRRFHSTLREGCRTVPPVRPNGPQATRLDCILVDGVLSDWRMLV